MLAHSIEDFSKEHWLFGMCIQIGSKNNSQRKKVNYSHKYEQMLEHRKHDGLPHTVRKHNLPEDDY